MSDSLSRAQEIYVDNLGSTFYMARNGVLNEYRSLRVTPEEEQAWRQELISEMAVSLETDSLKRLDSLVEIARYHGDSLIIEAIVLYIMNNLGSLDSYMRLIFAGRIWELVGSASREATGGPYSQARSMAIRIWQNIVNSPVQLAPDSCWKLPEGNASREEYIKREAQKCLDNAI